MGLALVDHGPVAVDRPFRPARALRGWVLRWRTESPRAKRKAGRLRRQIAESELRSWGRRFAAVRGEDAAVGAALREIGGDEDA